MLARSRHFLSPITPGAARSLVIMFALMAAMAAANLLFTSHEVNNVRAAVLASCAFAADVGSAPVQVPPGTGKPSELGVAIVADSRAEWRRLGCPGHLPPPQPSFSRWARFYHLPSS